MRNLRSPCAVRTSTTRTQHTRAKGAQTLQKGRDNIRPHKKKESSPEDGKEEKQNEKTDRRRRQEEERNETCTTWIGEYINKRGTGETVGQVTSRLGGLTPAGSPAKLCNNEGICKQQFQRGPRLASCSICLCPILVGIFSRTAPT